MDSVSQQQSSLAQIMGNVLVITLGSVSGKCNPCLILEALALLIGSPLGTQTSGAVWRKMKVTGLWSQDRSSGLGLEPWTLTRHVPAGMALPSSSLETSFLRGEAHSLRRQARGRF